MSRVDIEKSALLRAEKAAVEAGEFSAVVKRFDIKEFEGKSPDERIAIVDRWADECEGATVETETGNEFREIEDVRALAIEYVCVKP